MTMTRTHNVSKAELRELVETMAIFQRLPEIDQIAIKYYLKGRIDATAGRDLMPEPPPPAYVAAVSNATVSKAI